MVVCERVEGRVGREDLVLRLQQAIRNNEAEMVAERVERSVGKYCTCTMYMYMYICVHTCTHM